MRIRNRATLAVALMAAALLSGACGDAAPEGSDASGNRPTAVEPAQGDSGGAGNMTPGGAKAPPKPGDEPALAPGSAARVKGTVVSLACLKQTPEAKPETLSQCTKDQAKAGGALAVLGDDGIIYIGAAGPQTTTRVLQPVAGVRVFVDGNPSSDPVDITLPPYEIRKFDMRGVRKEDVKSEGVTDFPVRTPSGEGKKASEVPKQKLGKP